MRLETMHRRTFPVLEPMALAIIFTCRSNNRRIDNSAGLHSERLGLELAGDHVEQGLIKTVHDKAPARPNEGGALWRKFRAEKAAKASEGGTIIQCLGQLHVRQVIPD